MAAAVAHHCHGSLARTHVGSSSPRLTPCTNNHHTCTIALGTLALRSGVMMRPNHIRFSASALSTTTTTTTSTSSSSTTTTAAAAATTSYDHNLIINRHNSGGIYSSSVLINQSSPSGRIRLRLRTMCRDARNHRQSPDSHHDADGASSESRSSEESATGDTDEYSTSTTGKEHKQQEEGAKNQGQFHIFSFTRVIGTIWFILGLPWKIMTIFRKEKEIFQEVEENVEKVADTIEKTAEMVEEVAKGVEQVANAVEKVAEGVQTVVEELHIGSPELLDAARRIDSIAHNIASDARKIQSIADKVEEQTDSIQGKVEHVLDVLKDKIPGLKAEEGSTATTTATPPADSSTHSTTTKNASKVGAATSSSHMDLFTDPANLDETYLRSPLLQHPCAQVDTNAASPALTCGDLGPWKARRLLKPFVQIPFNVSLLPCFITFIPSLSLTPMNRRFFWRNLFLIINMALFMMHFLCGNTSDIIPSIQALFMTH